MATRANYGTIKYTPLQAPSKPQITGLRVSDYGKWKVRSNEEPASELVSHLNSQITIRNDLLRERQMQKTILKYGALPTLGIAAIGLAITEIEHQARHCSACKRHTKEAFEFIQSVNPEATQGQFKTFQEKTLELHKKIESKGLKQESAEWKQMEALVQKYSETGDFNVVQEISEMFFLLDHPELKP